MNKKGAKMEEEDTDFDADSNIGVGFTAKEGLSKEDIIMEAWRDCRQKRSQEMRRGYYNTKFDARGRALKVWIPDTREQYISAVKSFHLILSGDFDEDYKKARKEIYEQEEKAFKKYSWKVFKLLKVPDKDYPNSFKYKKEYTGQIVMPEPEESNLWDIDINGKRVNVDWKNNCHQYIQSLVLIYDELFAEIIKLLKRLKYFKSKVRFG